MVTVPRRVMEEETRSARLRRWADETRQLVRILASRSEGKTGQIYDIIGTQNLYGEESLFINFGYWKDDPATLDEASRDLARLAARSADFNPSDVVVDCGPGYGDQDILWVNEFGVKHITGINVAAEQIAIATRRSEEAGLADRIDYVHASAIALPLEDQSCTKVVALESAFHFPSRVDFFSEALRVLEPGGQLVTADIVPKKTFLNTRYRKEVARLGWRGASPQSHPEIGERRGLSRPAARHRICRSQNPIYRAQRFPAAGRFLMEENVRAGQEVCESASAE